MLFGNKDKKWRVWVEDLAEKISEDIFKKEDDPLDGDETELLGKLLCLELDWRQGNLDLGEYSERKKMLEKGEVW